MEWVRNENYKRIPIYASSESELEEKVLQYKIELAKGMQAGVKMKLDDWMIKWYEAYKKGNKHKKISIKTDKMYQNAINYHISPVLGQMDLKEIRQINIRRFLNKLIGSRSKIHKIYITLNQIFKTAVGNGYIGINPMDGIKIDAPDDPKRRFLTDTQRIILLDALTGHKGYDYVFALLYTGMRMGECIALTWNDIDLENKIIHVNKAIEYDGVKPLIKAPKTKNGVRDIFIPKELADLLMARKQRINSIYVFPWCDKDGIHTQTSIDNLWRKIRGAVERYFKINKKDKDDVKKHKEELRNHRFNLTYRVLRHTYATALYDAKIDESLAKRQMGHSTIQVTKDIYTHIQESKKKEISNKIDKLFQAKPQRKRKPPTAK
jgi:integrase